MRRLAVVAGSAVALGVMAVPSGTTATSGVSAGPSLAAPPAVIVHYGHIRSLVRSGSRYRMRFDPALWLSGASANRAAVEDGAIPPGDAVPNDYYVRDESRKQLTYFVAPSARVTVVTNAAGGLRSTRISVSELAAIVKGKNPNGRKLYGVQLGYWIRVAGDTVLALDQQYQP
jgi:hypothetical protein